MNRGISAALVVVLALVAGLVAAGVTFVLVRDGGGDDVATADTDGGSSGADGGDPAGDDNAGDGASGSESGDPGPTTPTPRPVPQPTPSSTPPLGGAPPAGGWVAVLASTPVGEGRAAADARLAELRAVAPAAQLALSDDYASLNPGYWITYVPGFTDEPSVIAFCQTRGLDVPAQCYGRILSQDSADRATGGG